MECYKIKSQFKGIKSRWLLFILFILEIKINKLNVKINGEEISMHILSSQPTANEKESYYEGTK